MTLTPGSLNEARLHSDSPQERAKADFYADYALKQDLAPLEEVRAEVQRVNSDIVDMAAEVAGLESYLFTGVPPHGQVEVGLSAGGELTGVAGDGQVDLLRQQVSALSRNAEVLRAALRSLSRIRGSQ